MVVNAIDPNSADLVIITLSATLAGSVFGDHCSPISDTTVLSSAGAGCVHIEHVYTQLPYTVIVAASSFIGYAVAGITHSLSASFLTAFVIMIVSVVVIRKRANAS